MATDKPTTVREIMHSGVIDVDPEETLDRAAETMTAHDVSGLVVGDDLLEGIVTSRDLLRTLGEGRGDVHGTSVRDAMSDPVATIPPNVSAEDALRAMARNGLHRLPVLEDGRVVGMVTERDILQARPDLAPIARSFDRQLSTANTDWVRLAGRCDGCDELDTDLREVDEGHYCYRCAGGLRSRDTPSSSTGW